MALISHLLFLLPLLSNCWSSEFQKLIAISTDNLCTNVTLSAGDRVTVTSPLYPDKYPNNAFCTNYITSDGEVFVYQCIGRIRRSQKCRKDYLQICSEFGCSKRLCRKFEASGEVDSTHLKFIFRSNSKRRMKGFECHISALGTSAKSSTTSAISTTNPSTLTTGDTSATTEIPKCRCGKVNRRTRIVGGMTTDIHEYPWQAGLMFFNSKRVTCGASIVSKYWVITAAHCTVGKSAPSVRVRAGDHVLTSSSDTSRSSTHKVIQIINHDYNDHNKDNDIALLKVESPFVFDPGNRVAPACLPTSTEDLVGKIGTVSGWGVTKYQGTLSDTLRDVHVPILSKAYCRTVYGSLITNNMICAGTAQGGKDSCQGDSGGPFVVQGGTGNNSLILEGVVSFGYRCGEPSIPGVYARVSEYLDWIDDHIKTDEKCPI